MGRENQSSVFAELRKPLSGRQAGRWYLRPGLIGVYRLVYHPNGACYVGSSKRCIANRLLVHLTGLRNRKHSSSKLQEEWDSGVEDDWDFEILELCSADDARERERYWQRQFDIQLSMEFDPTSLETRKRQSEGRARYLETPGVREELSRRAVVQHRERRFGY